MNLDMMEILNWERQKEKVKKNLQMEIDTLANGKMMLKMEVEFGTALKNKQKDKGNGKKGNE